MPKKAVIDLGSLKLKLSIFDASTRELLTAESHLTLLGKGIDEHQKVPSDSLQKLDAALKIVARKLRARQITDIHIIGTEALRKAKNIAEVHACIARHFPHHALQVIDQHTEGELFFRAVSREFPNQEIVAMDIGGGSVQLIYGKYLPKTNQLHISNTHHFATGTYRLKQVYSAHDDKVSQNYPAASTHIEKTFQEVTGQSTTLVFGSSCMLDFIVASKIPSSINSQNSVHPLRVSADALEALLGELCALPPQERSHYYPSGGYFMHGADFLLMNVLAAIRRTGATKIYPTNLSSAYGFM